LPPVQAAATETAGVPVPAVVVAMVLLWPRPAVHASAQPAQARALLRQRRLPVPAVHAVAHATTLPTAHAVPDGCLRGQPADLRHHVTANVHSATTTA